MFDFIIANHVLEHIPNLIAFFLDIAEVLKPNGKICLAIPDKRFCFDRFRNQTSFAECYEVYRKKQAYSPIRILDYSINYSLNDPVYFWHNQHKFDMLISPNEELFNTAIDKYERAIKFEAINYPVHYHVFTPESFLILLYNMTSFFLCPFIIKEFYYTRMDSQEFCCVLELDKNLLQDKQRVLVEKNNIVKLLNKNYDSLIYCVSKIILRKLLFIPLIVYRILRK